MKKLADLTQKQRDHEFAAEVMQKLKDSFPEDKIEWVVH